MKLWIGIVETNAILLRAIYRKSDWLFEQKLKYIKDTGSIQIMDGDNNENMKQTKACERQKPTDAFFYVILIKKVRVIHRESQTEAGKINQQKQINDEKYEENGKRKANRT